MNANKAREYFSAYFEGDLDAGLKQQFEQTLQNDAEVRSEYELFTQTMQFLADYEEQEIEIPFDLNEQISRKVDSHVWNQKQSEKPGFFAQWRMAIVGGAAALAILAAVVTINSNGSQEFTPSGLTPSQNAQVFPLSYSDDQIRLNIKATDAMTITVVDLDTEAVIETLEVKKNTVFDGPLTNEKSEAAALQINFGGSEMDPIVVVLPGAVDSPDLEGEGTAVEFAKAVAQTFRTPVIVRLSEREMLLTWAFDESMTAEELPTLMKDKPASLVVQGNGFLALSDN